MRIGIDLFSLVPDKGRGGGFHRYATSLVHGLHELDDGLEYVLFVNRGNRHMFPSGGRFQQHVIPLPPQRALWPFRLLWQQALLPVLARRLNLDAVHFPFDTGTALWGPRYVVTIHDLIADTFYPARFPNSMSRLKTLYLLYAKRWSARCAVAVICPSSATAEGVVHHYGVAKEKITVIPEAPADQFLRHSRSEPPRASGGRPYVLSVVSLSTHKNVEGIVDAFERARALHALPHELRIVGMSGTGSARIERFLIDAERRGIPLRYSGFVDEDTLVDLYRDAALLLYLPWVEGFGLPPLEAMAMGVPVVASDVASLPEVCGDAAILVPPDDIDGAARAVVTVLTDVAVATRLAEAGRCHAKTFSWLEAARRTRAVYDSLVPVP